MVTKKYTIWCDGNNCIKCYSNGECSISELKKNAKKNGWIINHHGDYCSECSKEIK